jgi:hypothetical protein
VPGLCHLLLCLIIARWILEFTMSLLNGLLPRHSLPDPTVSCRKCLSLDTMKCEPSFNDTKRDRPTKSSLRLMFQSSSSGGTLSSSSGPTSAAWGGRPSTSTLDTGTVVSASILRLNLHVSE